MPYLLDYLEAKLASFEEEPLNPVDSAALTQPCMVRGEDVLPPLEERKSFAGLRTILRNVASKTARPVPVRDMLRAERFPGMFTGLDPKNIKLNLFALAASPRFRTMCAHDYLSLFDAERETQFAAMTFTAKKQFTYVGFRGTDTSLAGWKENFNMAFADAVPAQHQALRYLEAIAAKTTGPLYVGGHSKGGNLAEYAALKAAPEIQARIERVFIHDGPGFKEGVFSPEDYAPLSGRIHKTIPTESFVGILLESQAPVSVVKSRAKGLDQHSVFSWEVDDALDDFAYADELPESTKLMAESLREWLARFDDREREAVVESVFRAIEASGADDAEGLLSGGGKSLAILVDALKKADAVDRGTLIDAGKTFVGAAVDRAAARLRNERERSREANPKRKSPHDEGTEDEPRSDLRE